MGWSVRQIAAALADPDGIPTDELPALVDLNNPGRHSYFVTCGSRAAALSSHHGASTEITDIEIKKVCRRLHRTPETVLVKLRGG